MVICEFSIGRHQCLFSRKNQVHVFGWSGMLDFVNLNNRSLFQGVTYWSILGPSMMEFASFFIFCPI